MVHAFVRKSSVRIDQVLSVAIPDDVDVNDAQSLGTLIRSALHEAGIGTKRALVDIPRHQANLYPLKLPRAAFEDLVQMVALQIPKELPFSVDQAAIDFAAPPETGEGETCDVLVAAVLKDTLAFYRRVFEHAGLKLERVGLRPYASHVAVNALLEATPHRHVLFVDVGPTATEIDVLRDKRLVFSRAANVEVPAESDSVSLHVKPREETKVPESAEADDAAALKLDLSGGGGDSLGTDAVVNELLIEVTRSIEAYRVTEAGAEMDHAVVGGSCDIEELLAEAIQKRFNITAQPYNPASCFGWEADRGAAAGAFAATIGLVLSQVQARSEQFDFLHPKRVETRAERGIKRAPIAATIVVLFLVAAVVGWVRGVKPQYETRAFLKGEIRDIKKKLDSHNAFAKLVAVAEDFEKDQIIWLDVLRDVVATLPPHTEFVLKDIDVSEKGRRIKMGFRAIDAEVASKLVQDLEALRRPDGQTGLFKAKLGTTSASGTGFYPHEGTLEVSVSGPAEARRRGRARDRRKG